MSVQVHALTLEVFSNELPLKLNDQYVGHTCHHPLKRGHISLSRYGAYLYVKSIYSIRCMLLVYGAGGVPVHKKKSLVLVYTATSIKKIYNFFLLLLQISQSVYFCDIWLFLSNRQMI